MKKTISLVLVLALGLASVSLAAEDTWTQKADMPTARFGRICIKPFTCGV